MKSAILSINNFMRVLPLFALTGCLMAPDLNTEDKKETILDLKVPTNFEWRMIDESKLTISSVKDTEIAIYSDRECNDENLIAFLPVLKGESNTTCLNLPKGSTCVYVKYKREDASFTLLTVPIDQQGNIHVVLPDDTSLKKTKTKSSSTTSQNYAYYYPNQGWGTVMFEDLFPSLGDYDFNDFAANYRVDLNLNPYFPYLMKSMTVNLRVKAVGGSLDLTPCLRIKGMTQQVVDHERITFVCSNNSIFKVRSIQDKGDALFLFENACHNDNKPVNSKYLNTEPGFLLKENQIVSIRVDIPFNYGAYGISVDYFKNSAFDFFLMNDNKTNEIHMRGFSPVYANYPADMSGLPVKYANKDNLVWGINIPANVPHAIEKANFMDCYPNFRSWVVSNEALNKDWYLKPNYQLTIK